MPTVLPLCISLVTSFGVAALVSLALLGATQRHARILAAVLAFAVVVETGGVAAQSRRGHPLAETFRNAVVDEMDPEAGVRVGTITVDLSRTSGLDTQTLRWAIADAAVRRFLAQIAGGEIGPVLRSWRLPPIRDAYTTTLARSMVEDFIGECERIERESALGYLHDDEARAQRAAEAGRAALETLAAAEAGLDTVAALAALTFADSASVYPIRNRSMPGQTQDVYGEALAFFRELSDGRLPLSDETHPLVRIMRDGLFPLLGPQPSIDEAAARLTLAGSQDFAVELVEVATRLGLASFLRANGNPERATRAEALTSLSGSEEATAALQLTVGVAPMPTAQAEGTNSCVEAIRVLALRTPEPIEWYAVRRATVCLINALRAGHVQPAQVAESITLAITEAVSRQPIARRRARGRRR